MDSQTIGNRIKNFRKEKGLSQKDLASMVGVTWEMVSRYERGRSSPLLKIIPIAKALSVPTEALLAEYEDKELADKVMYYSERMVPLLTVMPSEPRKFWEVALQSIAYVNTISKFEPTYLCAIDLALTHFVIDSIQIQKKGIVLIKRTEEETEGKICLISYRREYFIADPRRYKHEHVLGRVVQWILPV